MDTTSHPRPRNIIRPSNPHSVALWQMWMSSGLTRPHLAAKMAGYLGSARRDPSTINVFIREGSTRSDVPAAFARAVSASERDVSDHALALAREAKEKRLKNNCIL